MKAHLGPESFEISKRFDRLKKHILAEQIGTFEIKATSASKKHILGDQIGRLKFQRPFKGTFLVFLKVGVVEAEMRLRTSPQATAKAARPAPATVEIPSVTHRSCVGALGHRKPLGGGGGGGRHCVAAHTLSGTNDLASSFLM